ncbi:uncharacterized protein [Dysidea avara]|uniref:uncharacterized protein isoform X2 n=1 Tax=Dysidea avara TaxID=196820 RepID=UPI0033284B01
MYTFDAAPKCNDPGRYINHASHHPNLRLMQPVLIGQQLRIGFIALKMIQKGDELFFNYHIKDKDIEWRNADAKKIGTTLQDADLGPSSTRSEWAKAIDIDEGLTEAVLTPSSTAAEWQKRIEPEEEALQTEEGTEEGIEEAQPGPLLTEEIHGQYEYRNKSENNKRLTRKRQRFRKYCPLEQCQKTPLKLSQHLIQFHKIMDADLRHRLCKSALKVESDTEEDSADDKTSWSSRKVRQKLSRHDYSDKETMSPPTKKYKREKDDSDSDYDGDYNEFTINEAQQDELLLVEQYHLGTCFATDFCQDSFFEYLTSEGRNPDTAKTAARSVNYFFTYKQYMQKTPLNIILNKANIREYINHLQKVKMYAGTTVLERVGWLKAAVDYLTEDNSDNIRLHLRVQEVHKTIARLKSTISKKTIREQRATQARLSDAKIQTEESPKVFIESDEVVNAVNNAIRRAQTTTLSSHDHKLVIGYLAANLIYDNGQRPGVIQYMEINEYLERRSIDGHEITLVCKHKTGIQRGPAKVVVSNQMIISLLQAYYENIRMKLEAVNQQMTKRFFLLPSGNEFRKVYELMNAIALEFNISLPTPTSHRKLISTDASEHLSAEEMALLHKYMSHSSQTSDKYYQKTTFTAAIKSHKNIEVLSQKRRGFTAKQDKDLLMEWPNTNTPPLSVCRLIATKYRISKDAQQIQDRLKYLLKKNMS